jgi:hypothetical protein
LEPWIVGQADRDGRWLPFSLLLEIEALADSAQVGSILGQCRRDRCFECLRAMGVQELQQSPC